MNYNTLCLSGGGVLGLSFLGVIEKLEENGFNLSTINHFVGTSVGSIICFFYSIGYTTDEIKNFALEFDFNSLETEINLDNLIEKFGLNDGSKFILLFTFFLKEKLNINDITFLELFQMTNIKLSIIGVNFTKNEEELFNYILTPNMSVITAVRISISIPLIFIPVYHNNCYYIDGCFLNGFAINYCDPNTTLGIYIKKYNSISQLKMELFGFIKNCLNILSNAIFEKNKFNILNTIIINNSHSETDFGVDKENKQIIYNNGINSATNFLKNQSNDICRNIIINIINKFLSF